MVELLIELITLILARLPVKALLRFKCVSREWNSLISTNHFAKLHRSHSPPGGHIEDHYLLAVDRKFEPKTRVRWNCYIERWALDSNLTPTYKFVLPSPPGPTTTGYVVRVVCSCNGLVILICSYFDELSRKCKASELIMWNPSIKNHYFVLPSTGIINSTREFNFYGLGYDKSNEDYKLVRFAFMYNQFVDTDKNIYTCSRQIYSSKHNRWGVPFNEDTRKIYPEVVYARTALIDEHIVHWLFREGLPRHYGDFFLRGFDVCSEEWIDLPLPDLPQQDGFKCLFKNLGVLDKCLCLGSHTYNMTQVWVMKAYGVKESWTKLFVLSDVTTAIQGNPRLIKSRLIDSPLAYSEGGDEVLIRVIGSLDEDKDYCKKSLIWYNLKDKTETYARSNLGANVTHLVASLNTLPKYLEKKQGIAR